MQRVLFLSLFLMIGSFVHASESNILLTGVATMVNISANVEKNVLREEIDRLDEEIKCNAILIEKYIKQLKKIVPVQEKKVDWLAKIDKNPAAKQVYWQLRVVNALHEQNIKQSYRLLKQVADWNQLLKSGIEK